MPEAIASFSAPNVLIQVIAGEDQQFPFDVMIDGVLLDSFMVLSAALNNAYSAFKIRMLPE